MDCGYYDAGRCRSCTLLETPYDDQLTAKQAHVESVLAPGTRWLPPVASRESGFRNKAKMVVGGTVEAPTLGILDAEQHGVDLQGCGLHEPAVTAALPVLAGFVTTARLTPYDVPSRRGELKHLLVTASPTGDLMVRFVLRSTEPVSRIRKHLPSLQAALPLLAVLSVNLQPEHKAVLEGEQEIVLTPSAALPMPVGGVDLLLRPQSFFQTNTAVADALYRQVRAWVDAVAPARVWDLYCGVGGFALACAAPGRDVLGVETSAEAVASAQAATPADGDHRWSSPTERQRGRTSRPPGPARFVTADATEFALTAADHGEPLPDLIIVNPPRRGIGSRLATWLEQSGVPHVVYSSCNPETLARDLAEMPSLRPVEARLFDMFPQTGHHEVAVRLRSSYSPG